MKYLAVILAAAVLVACTDAPSPASPRGQADACDAVAYQNLVGQDRVVALALPDPKRIYRLGDPVTLDFLPNRLNVKLDETDVIVAIDCG